MARKKPPEKPPEEPVRYFAVDITNPDVKALLKVVAKIQRIRDLERVTARLVGPLTPEHCAMLQTEAKRMHRVCRVSYATLYRELHKRFGVRRFRDISDYYWPQVEDWLFDRFHLDPLHYRADERSPSKG